MKMNRTTKTKIYQIIALVMAALMLVGAVAGVLFYL